MLLGLRDPQAQTPVRGCLHVDLGRCDVELCLRIVYLRSDQCMYGPSAQAASMDRSGGWMAGVW